MSEVALYGTASAPLPGPMVGAQEPELNACKISLHRQMPDSQFNSRVLRAAPLPEPIWTHQMNPLLNFPGLKNEFACRINPTTFVVTHNSQPDSFRARS